MPLPPWSCFLWKHQFWHLTPVPWEQCRTRRMWDDSRPALPACLGLMDEKPVNCWDISPNTMSQRSRCFWSSHWCLFRHLILKQFRLAINRDSLQRLISQVPLAHQHVILQWWELQSGRLLVSKQLFEAPISTSFPSSRPLITSFYSKENILSRATFLKVRLDIESWIMWKFQIKPDCFKSF